MKPTVPRSLPTLSVGDTRLMVLNIRLIDRQTADSDDPLPRGWWGYDAQATPEELWEHNRGVWILNDKRIADERWAALNYQGRIILVAELHGPDHEIVVDNRTGTSKKALKGRVLLAGNPIHDVLIGEEVIYRRNPVSYDPDPAIAETLDGAADESSLDVPGVGGQGVQMDPDLRKAIENAAQDRLMRHYRDDGWHVADTRHNRPYDAVAVKGSEMLFLEAKGTQSRGETVIVTRNEVANARQHPGLCIMGVWSGMRLVDGVVDPEAGAFRLLAFEPDDDALRPRDFDWTLPASEI
ncbi:hypothetical protein AAur_pTC20007 (plasmid) [Paenarthrobacter aurescens TC1]|uniref:Protein NO VEIN C-terminal domain-containing protein n=2 Tax=Paenarthrobacter aurescens TaxID=43663 RepID=A1RD61_PAEAT|nr:hypothetical protein AAur_pTC20007 [Paenarthrobacter aurescens TC1]